jgi:hypothetical protein
MKMSYSIEKQHIFINEFKTNYDLFIKKNLDLMISKYGKIELDYSITYLPKFLNIINQLNDMYDAQMDLRLTEKKAIQQMVDDFVDDGSLDALILSKNIQKKIKNYTKATKAKWPITFDGANLSSKCEFKKGTINQVKVKTCSLSELFKYAISNFNKHNSIYSNYDLIRNIHVKDNNKYITNLYWVARVSCVYDGTPYSYDPHALKEMQWEGKNSDMYFQNIERNHNTINIQSLHDLACKIVDADKYIQIKIGDLYFCSEFIKQVTTILLKLNVSVCNPVFDNATGLIYFCGALDSVNNIDIALMKANQSNRCVVFD